MAAVHASSPPGRQGGTLAIDLGSSSTVVAFQAEAVGSRPVLLPVPPYSSDEPIVVPSLLWLSDRSALRPLIGRQVLEAGLVEAGAPGLIQDFKRRIGGTAPDSDAEGLIPAETAGSLLLTHLIQALPPGMEIHRLVCTAPIEALSGYRRWLQQLGQELRIPELALVDEPTAAALGCRLAPGSRVLVVDVGGGTIDLSLVELPGGEGRAAPIAQLLRFAGRDLGSGGQKMRCARVLGKAGIRLGGRDLDRWLAEELNPGGAPAPGLLAACERLKCALSSQGHALVTWSDGQEVKALQLSRDRWESILRERGLVEALDRMLGTVLAAGRAEGVTMKAIDAVLPVGGGSHLPLIQSWLKERCPGVPIHIDRPIEAVALGALALTPGVAIRDVLSRGVSLRCWDQRLGGHRWHPLFLPGQSWPTEHPLELVLACSEPDQRVVELVLGEPDSEERHEVIYRDGVPMLRAQPAGQTEVRAWSGDPVTLPIQAPVVAGEDRLRLRFAINRDAELTVEWLDLNMAAAERGDPPRIQRLTLGMVR